MYSVSRVALTRLGQDGQLAGAPADAAPKSLHRIVRSVFCGRAEPVRPQQVAASSPRTPQAYIGRAICLAVQVPFEDQRGQADTGDDVADRVVFSALAEPDRTKAAIWGQHGTVAGERYRGQQRAQVVRPGACFRVRDAAIGPAGPILHADRPWLPGLQRPGTPQNVCPFRSMTADADGWSWGWQAHTAGWRRGLFGFSLPFRRARGLIPTLPRGSCLADSAGEARDEQRREHPRQQPQHPADRGQPGRGHTG